MRIAVLTSEFPSVSETFVLGHVADLVERGHEVDVYPERGPQAEVAHPDVDRLGLLARRHLPPPMPRAKLARLVRAARLALEQREPHRAALLRSVNPMHYGRQGASLSLLYRQLPFLEANPYDVVHGHHGPVGLLAARLRQLGVLRGRLVVTFHGHDVNVAARRRGRALYAPLFREADWLLANSEFLRGRLIALGAAPARVLRHPVGVDLLRFRPSPEPPSETFRILSVGRLVPEKGFDVALRAVARLARRRSRLRYTIVGDGPQRPLLERLAGELGLAERVCFLGSQPQDRVSEQLAGCHVFCLPSVVGGDGAEESQGLALVEAQACGRPVIASAIGGVSQSLRDGISGFAVPQRDSAALADRLETLLSCPELRAAMGRAGRAHAARHFDRQRLADRLERLYVEPPPPLGPPASDARPRIGLA